MIVKLVSFLKIRRKKLISIQKALQEIQEVVKILVISGEADILIEIHAPYGDEMVKIIENIEQIPDIKEINSHFVLDEWYK